MKQSGWYVVKFMNENTIETIPSSWMINFDKCVWPTTLSTSKLRWAIKNSLKPIKNSEDWKCCQIKVLCKKLITNFKEASKLTDDLLTQPSTEAESYQPNKVLKEYKDVKKKEKEVLVKNVQSPFIKVILVVAAVVIVIQYFLHYQNYQVRVFSSYFIMYVIVIY